MEDEELMVLTDEEEEAEGLWGGGGRCFRMKKKVAGKRTKRGKEFIARIS